MLRWISVILALVGIIVGARGLPLGHGLSRFYSNNTLIISRVCRPVDQYCCQRLYDKDRTKERAILRDFLGLDIPFNDYLVGVSCTPIQMTSNVIKCESPVVCCTGGQEYVGLVNTHCSLKYDEQIGV
ncbi:unnamed protein product [Rhizoctonia solani]|uniref:Hydrophobin n=1 Tax=Rhizoctonia solani TaxID=456999 RepID=A0A8H2Y4Y9_9AGAM|nr:unnamed protein product [Rhizoctonia solani]